MTTPVELAVWMVVLSFSTGMSITVAPTGAPQGYASERTCKADIPGIRRSWMQQGLPDPNAIRCKQLKVK